MSRRLDLCAAEDVPPGTMKMCEVDDELVLVTNLGGTFHATQGVCSHEYFELDRGFLTGESLTCALHLSRFSLDDGEAVAHCGIGVEQASRLSKFGVPPNFVG